MNWHLSHLGSAVSFLLLCFVLCWWVCFWLVFGFVWWWLRDGLLDCTQVLYQFTLEASQSADGHVYALINPCSPICNMQLNVLNDLAEAMKALDGKKKRGGDINSSRSCFKATKQNLFVTSFAGFCFARLWRRSGGAAFRRLTLCTEATIIWCSIDSCSSSENMTIFAHQSRYPLSIWRFDLCVQGPCPVHLWPHPRKKKRASWERSEEDLSATRCRRKGCSKCTGLASDAWLVSTSGWTCGWLVQQFLQCCKCEVTPNSGDVPTVSVSKAF